MKKFFMAKAAVATYYSEAVYETQFVPENGSQGQQLSAAEIAALIGCAASKAYDQDMAFWYEEGYEAGLDEPRHYGKAFKLEVADSYLEGEYAVHKEMGGAFEYTFAGGTQITSDLPLDLAGFAQMVRGRVAKEDWRTSLARMINVILDEQGRQDAEFNGEWFGDLCVYGITTVDGEAAVLAYDSDGDATILIENLILDEDSAEVLTDMVEALAN
jgi:hypothetical protein